MLIPLGFWAASAGGGAPVGAGSFDLLETQVLASSAASVTFSSLSTYAADYQHLQIRATTRATGDAGTVLMRFNGDSATNYSLHRLLANGSTVNSYGSTSSSGIFAGANQINTGVANSFGASVIDILDPFETTKYTTARALGGSPAGGVQMTLFSGNWRNTDALTSITLLPNVASWDAKSRFSLYGIKAGA